jgi:hypothetical protein
MLALSQSMRWFVLVALLLCAGAPARLEAAPSARARPEAAVQAVPLPLPRPPEAAPRVPAQPAAPPEPAGPSECFVNLTSGIAVAEAMPPIVGPNGCGAQDVVRLDAVMLRDQRRVQFKPPPTLRCSMATAVSNWLREDVADQVLPLGAPLAGVENYDSYDCRPRNRVAGAETSEHGRANAIDIRSLTLTNGKRFGLTDPEVKKTVRDSLKAGACARFMTVLGPGSDGYHEEHIHLDLAERRNGFRICQWDVNLPVPLPRARPPEAPPREEG